MRGSCKEEPGDSRRDARPGQVLVRTMHRTALSTCRFKPRALLCYGGCDLPVLKLPHSPFPGFSGEIRVEGWTRDNGPEHGGSSGGNTRNGRSLEEAGGGDADTPDTPR